MNMIQDTVIEVLVDGGYAVASLDDVDGQVILFENDSVLGFVLIFQDVATLLGRWQATSQRVLLASQFALRRAENKAWNCYLVLLAETEPDYGQSTMLGAIEEDLVGTRKIARGGISEAARAHAALLPLLAIQNAPHLEAVEMSAEIRLRTSELPSEIVEAFLGSASEATMAQLLEAGQ